MDTITQDSICFLGELPDEPDNIPITPPNGFFWITGGRWGGETETYGIAEARISHDGGTIDFVMTLDDTLSLRELLNQAIDAMRLDGDDEKCRGSATATPSKKGDAA